MHGIRSRARPRVIRARARAIGLGQGLNDYGGPMTLGYNISTRLNICCLN